MTVISTNLNYAFANLVVAWLYVTVNQNLENCSPFIMLCLRSIGLDHVIRKLYANGILRSFSHNSFVNDMVKI